jgi:glycosyltransferase involved in cell wall biosynthesis
MGLRVAITNLEMWPSSGTVLYVRDLALELARLGHEPVVCSSTYGEIPDQLRAAGITITNSLRGIRRPDIIHGHHYAPTLLALQTWPSTRAIHFCHDFLLPEDRTPLAPRIARHFGVSRLCLTRMITEGAPPDATALMPNFVDMNRFRRRGTLPERPRRALIFSNYARADTYVPVVEAACRDAGIALDVVGAGVGRAVANPESVLPDYDVVFAKGRAALESMAVGCAVVLCDSAGVGPMVTRAEFEALQSVNFGFEALGSPFETEIIGGELARYDALEASRVSDLVRERAALDVAVAKLVKVYGQVLAGPPRARRPNERTTRLSRLEAASIQAFWRWRSVNPARRHRLARIPGVSSSLRWARSILRPGA